MIDPQSSPPLLRIEGATVARGGRRLLDGLSLEVAEGQHTAILGPNGSGKSTLLKLITRQHHPLAHPDGKPVISVFGRGRWDVFELRAMLGIVSADLHQAFVGDGARRGLEAVLSGFFASQGLAGHHRVTHAMRERAAEALELIGASHLAGKPLVEMSTGEARRILIARALAPDPRALILDEPTAGLDLAAARRFLDVLRHVAARGKTLILVTHHVEEILPEIGRVILLRDGRVFRDGPKADVLTGAVLSELFDAPVAVHEVGGYYAAELGREK